MSIQQQPPAGCRIELIRDPDLVRDAVDAIRETASVLNDREPWKQSSRNYSGREHRAEPRHKIEVPITILPVDLEGEFAIRSQPQLMDIGVTRDVSAHGLGWRQTAPDDSEAVLVEFDAMAFDHPIGFIVEVCWTNCNRSWGFDRGGSFLGMVNPPVIE